MIKLSVVQGYHELQQRDFVKDGVSTRRYSQFLYAHTGGAFPERISVSLEKPEDLLPIGDYELLPSAFKVGQYDALELQRFGLLEHIKPLKKAN